MSQLTHAVRRSPRRARLTACAVLIALAALTLVWIGRASAEKGGANSPAAVSKSVSTLASKADAVDAIGGVCTQSAVYADMPGMLVSFKLGGTASRAVIVLFQGEWEAINSGSSAEIRLTIDNVIQSGPTDVGADRRAFDASDETETHGFNFISDPVTPGLHVARIQWRSPRASQACTFARSLIVLHK
jgi:hypothetical protein